MKSLTSQEKKILELIGRGLSSSRIAGVLQVSPHTVESHRKSLLVKFDAKNSAELVRKAIQLKALSIHNSDDDFESNIVSHGN
jgi:DNA-binding CsgD family transcriptional regulator